MMDCRICSARILIRSMVLLCISINSYPAAARPLENSLFEQTSPAFRSESQRKQSMCDGQGALSSREYRPSVEHGEPSSLNALGAPSSWPIPQDPVLSHAIGGANILRFELNTRGDTACLTETAIHLDLDIWAISQDWLDLRANQGEVRRCYRCYRQYFDPFAVLLLLLYLLLLLSHCLSLTSTIHLVNFCSLTIASNLCIDEGTLATTSKSSAHHVQSLDERFRAF